MFEKGERMRWWTDKMIDKDEDMKWLIRMRWWNDWDGGDDEIIEKEERKKDDKDEKVRKKGERVDTTPWYLLFFTFFFLMFINEILYSVYEIGFLTNHDENPDLPMYFKNLSRWQTKSLKFCQMLVIAKKKSWIMRLDYV